MHQDDSLINAHDSCAEQGRLNVRTLHSCLHLQIAEPEQVC